MDPEQHMGIRAARVHSGAKCVGAVGVDLQQSSASHLMSKRCGGQMSRNRHGSSAVDDVDSRRRSCQMSTEAGLELSLTGTSAGRQQSTTLLTRSSGDNDDRVDEQSTKCHIEHRAPENSGVEHKRTSSRWLQRNDRLHKSGHLEKNACVPLCVTCGCVCSLSIRNKLDIEWVHLDDVCLSLVLALLPRVRQVCCTCCVIVSLGDCVGESISFDLRSFALWLWMS